MKFDLDRLVRENIRRLVPYSSARTEFAGKAEIFLDANENAFGSPLAKNYNRYPDPVQGAVRKKVAEINGVKATQIFVGNGSDEAIDLMFRIFCQPGIDNIVICPPTYGMYAVAAGINDVEVKRAPLTSEFDVDLEKIRETIDDKTRLIFLCSPNNPTGNSIPQAKVLEIAEFFDGIVVVDEAYIHFSRERSLVSEIDHHPNLVVLQTFSKAWGLAGLRVGLAFARDEIIKLFDKVKPPYNVSQVAQELVLEALELRSDVADTVAAILNERKKLSAALSRFSFVIRIYDSDANFLLVKTDSANEIYNFLLEEKIVVRNRSSVELCEGCLRITVGTPKENQALIRALEKYEESIVH